MSDDTTAPESAGPTEHNNEWLKPYLKILAEGGESGLSKLDAETRFSDYFNSLGSDMEYAGGSKIRQTMYIAGLAKSSGSMIYLTAKGWEYINE